MDALTHSHGPGWHGASVLVVDDESTMRALVRRTLEAEDFEVEEANDGESALALIQARKEPFDLVLTDLSMYHAIRDTITRSVELVKAAEDELDQAHAGLSKLAATLESSRTMRVETVDLVIAARELRRIKGAD